VLLPLNTTRAERLKGEGDIVAVSSKVADDYVRVKGADGKFKPEVYAMGEGGVWGGQQNDYSIDKLRFGDVAKTIAVPLAEKNYVTGKSPQDTSLLIMVYWGTTAGSRDFARGTTQMAADSLKGISPEAPPKKLSMKDMTTSAAPALDDYGLLQMQLFNQIRDRISFENGQILGYDDELLNTRDHGLSPLHQRRVDVLEELEYNRYFVVLMAYDFQLMWKQKKAKLLWETRYSVSQRDTDFGMQLMDMTKQASMYFGQDSAGLQRKKLPGVKVEVGEAKVIKFDEKTP